MRLPSASLLAALLFYVAVPILGIARARARTAAKKASTLTLVVAGLWTLCTGVPGVATLWLLIAPRGVVIPIQLAPGLTLLVSALLGGYWLFLCSRANREARSTAR